MVLGALKFHVAASWALLLFLAAATQQVYATSSSNPCDDVCLEDTECHECVGGDGEFDHDTWSACLLDAEGSPCSAWPCCYDAANANDCLGNSLYVEYWLCIGCTDTDLMCGETMAGETSDATEDSTSAVEDDMVGDDSATGETAGDDTNGTDRVAFSYPSAMLTFVLGLAIVTFSSIQHG